ncbi:transcriptional regulator [Xanthomonas citri pv. malvacearum str. GSPB2388]|uniref:helix-turn-helix transcriptional regulator n=1 Tax=Xanthomonas citri TaxID=346 RepID=UPI000297B666|nr:helix-turn-helix transcriptional regulator [Xanthomonas citri]EKQ63227.1 transcriptional regulator [Xanthomonas citri pv. malvacearum str. GSPB2388]
MSIENPPTQIDALPPGVRASFEKADGPVLIAFLAELREVWAPETFRDETGLSFAQWRQQARLTEGLRRLSQGHAVAQVADQLGYSSPSAFVSVFHRHFGAPPTRYLAGSHARGLASPAASG